MSNLVRAPYRPLINKALFSIPDLILSQKIDNHVSIFWNVMIPTSKHNSILGDHYCLKCIVRCQLECHWGRCSQQRASLLAEATCSVQIERQIHRLTIRLHYYLHLPLLCLPSSQSTLKMPHRFAMYRLQPDLKAMLTSPNMKLQPEILVFFIISKYPTCG